MVRLLTLLVLGSAIIHSASFSQPRLQTRDVAVGLWVPWEIVWGQDDHIWITERPGMVSRIHPETGERREILNIRSSVAESHEAGMLGMALHPNMADTPHVFLVHTFWNGNDIMERLVRYTYDKMLDTLLDPVILLDSIPGGLFRVGSRLRVAGDRTLYMTTGDAGHTTESQNHMAFNGKVLRMNLDGSVPSDNPWATAPSPACYLWSTGHRNPQGLDFAPDGTLYISEHGHDTDDEINIVQRGRNYGWPYVAGYCSDTVLPMPTVEEENFCVDSNVVEPIRAWNPTIGPAGLVYYGYSTIPSWHHSLLLVTLGKLKPELPPYCYSLVQLKLSADGQRVVDDTAYFIQEFGRLRGICLSPDGRLFISTSNHDGRASAEHGFPRFGDDRIIEVMLNTSSVQPPPEQVEFRIVPMPVGGDARITFARELGRGSVELFDASGKKLRDGEFEGGEEYYFRRDNLQSGRYFLRITDGENRVDCSLVVR